MDLNSIYVQPPTHSIDDRQLLQLQTASTSSSRAGSRHGSVMPCLALRSRSIAALTSRLFSNTAFRQRRSPVISLREVPFLDSWDLDLFEESAYKTQTPARLPRSRAHLPPACLKWFLHDDEPSIDDLFAKGLPHSSELRASFWSDHEFTIVPLEITTRGSSSGSSTENETAQHIQNPVISSNGAEEFQRVEAPLKILLAYLANPLQALPGPSANLSIYLAQCDLSSLPESLQADVPLPALLKPASSRRSIKGDIYSSSLWLGRPPTYTPLHRDPNPNLFVQLAGLKTVRLLPPEVGDALYHDVTMTLSPSSVSFSKAIRGEEMMVGAQKAVLHDAIWPDTEPSAARAAGTYDDVLRRHGLETTLGLGDTLFIPKGWWHSVKGVGEGITASVNWWFR